MVVSLIFIAANMSYSNSSVGSGSRRGGRTLEFGGTYVVKPKGKHQATIVWLHGLADNGSTWSHMLENLRLPNIKWICPTAPTRPVAVLGGFPCPAWPIKETKIQHKHLIQLCALGFDVEETEEGSNDSEGLDASASHIANLLSTEPAGVKLGIGGFSMGGAAALHSATCFSQGKYGNGSPYPINLRAIVSLSGWLPLARNLKNYVGRSDETARRAASLPIFLAHGLCDEVVPFKQSERSYQTMYLAGFKNLAFKTYEGIGHYTVPKEMNDVCDWLSSTLGF